MVSLHITAIGYLISGWAAPEAYENLGTHGYLSDRALSEQEDVISLIEQEGVAFPKCPAPGHELWRDVHRALEQAGYLSPKGRTEGGRYLTRDGREVSEQRSGIRAKATAAAKSLLKRLADWLRR